MGWDAVGALANVASTLIVAVAAFAALLQIRHIRAGNQLAVILRLYERFDSAEMVEARRFCRDELPSLIASEEERQRMAGGELDGRVVLLTSFYTEIGSLVNDGLLEERLINRLGPPIRDGWSVIAPLAYDIRQRVPQPVWAAFEYVAVKQRRISAAERLAVYPPWFRQHVAAEKEARRSAVRD